VLQDTIAGDFCNLLRFDGVCSNLQTWDLDFGFPQPLSSRKEISGRSAVLKGKLAEIPFLRKTVSSVGPKFYQPVPFSLPMTSVQIVKPKPVRYNKENIEPLCSKNNNPEDQVRKCDKPIKTSDPDRIFSTELTSAMDYPARFLSFINHGNKLEDHNFRVLKPLAQHT
jgi:hypothetical protein